MQKFSRGKNYSVSKSNGDFYSFFLTWHFFFTFFFTEHDRSDLLGGRVRSCTDASHANAQRQCALTALLGFFWFFNGVWKVFAPSGFRPFLLKPGTKPNQNNHQKKTPKSARHLLQRASERARASDDTSSSTQESWEFVLITKPVLDLHFLLKRFSSTPPHHQTLRTEVVQRARLRTLIKSKWTPVSARTVREI